LAHVASHHDDLHQARPTGVVDLGEEMEGGAGHAYVAHGAWCAQLTTLRSLQSERVRRARLLSRGLLGHLGVIAGDAALRHLLRHDSRL
jgi:hypothetical protein